MPNRWVNKRICYFKNVPASSIDPVVQAWYDKVTTKPSRGYLQIVNSYWSCLSSGDNNASLLDRLVPFNTEWRDNAYVSIPNSASANGAEQGGLLWNEQGFEGALSSWYDTNYTPSTDGVNYTKDLACFFFWTRLNLDESTVAGGSQNTMGTANATLVFPKDGGSSYSDINDNNGANPAQAVANSIGLYSIVRINATTSQLWKNGIKIRESPVNSTATSDLEFWLLGLNKDGVLAFRSNNQIALYGAGSGAINQLELYNCTNAFVTAVDNYLPVNPLSPLPLNNPSLMLKISDLIDYSGNGLNSTLGASLPVGFTSPTYDADNNLVCSGLQAVKLNTGLNITKLSEQTHFFSFYTDFPETISNLFNIGLKYACGERIYVENSGGLVYSNSNGVFYNEGAASQPLYGWSLPKILKGYNTVGFCSSSTQTIMFVNGIVSYISPGFGAGPADTSGWIGGFPGGTLGNVYTIVANCKFLANSYVQVYDYTADLEKFKATGNLIMKQLQFSQIVFEGDSITAGQNITTNANNWPSYVIGNLIDNTAYKWSSCNIGIGGKALETMATNCNIPGTTYLALSGNLSADPICPAQAVGAKNVYVLLAGINDFIGNRTLADMQTNLAILINFRKSQGYQCFVLTPTPDNTLTAPQEAERVAYIADLPNLATSLGFVLINTTTAMGVPGGGNPNYSDTVHYSNFACQTIIGPMVYTSIINNI